MSPYIIPGIISPKSIKLRLFYILSVICEEMKISESKIRSKCRKGDLPKARHMFGKLSKECTLSSYRQIAKFIGYKDAGSVVNNVRAMQDLIDTEDYYKNLYERIKTKIC